MAIPPPTHEPPGVDIYIPWEYLKWALGGLASALVSVVGWVWHLGGRVSSLERSRDTMHETIRTLVKKIAEDDKSVKEALVRLSVKLDDIQEGIAAQHKSTNDRIDRLLEARSRRD